VTAETHAQTVRLPRELHERLRTAAYVHDTYQSDLIIEAIEEKLDQLDATHGQIPEGDR
jgi:predicted DNA-binding protein